MVFLFNEKQFPSLETAVKEAQNGINNSFFDRLGQIIYSVTDKRNKPMCKQVEIVIPANTQAIIKKDVKLELIDGVEVSLLGREHSSLVLHPTASLRIISKSRISAEMSNHEKASFRFHGVKFVISETSGIQQQHTYIKVAPGINIKMEASTLNQEFPDGEGTSVVNTHDYNYAVEGGPSHKFLSVKQNASAQITQCTLNNKLTRSCFEISCSGGAIQLQDSKLNGFTINIKNGANIDCRDSNIENRYGIGISLEGLSTRGIFSTVNISNSVVGFQVLDNAEATFSQCLISNCTSNGGEVLNGKCCTDQTKFLENGENGLLVGDLSSVSILSGSLFRMNGRSGLQVYTKSRGSKNLDDYTKCKIVNGSFLQNRFGLGIDNASVKVLGTTFFRNQEASIDLKFDEAALKSFRNTGVKFAWNNFFEQHTHESNNSLLAHLVWGEHSFRGKEQFEINIWSKELYERIQKADRISEFKRGDNQETIKALLESVRHCFALVPGTKPVVLEYLADTNATRCGFFAATYDIGSNGEKRYLLDINEVLGNWENLKYPGHFDIAIECYEEYFQAGHISKNKLEEVRETLKTWQLACFKKSKLGRQRGYFKVLTRSCPLQAYYLAAGFEPCEIRTMALTSLAVKANEAENKQRLHVSWIAKDSLDTLGRPFLEGKPPKEFELFCKWCELQLDIGSPYEVIKAFAASNNKVIKNMESDGLLAEAILISNGSNYPQAKHKNSFAHLVSRRGFEFIGIGPLPGFFRRLSERINGMLELLYILVDVGRFPFQNYLINATVYHVLIPDKQPLMSLSPEKCTSCSLLFVASDLIKIAACKLDHYWCETCFKGSFKTNLSCLDFATCPGEDCDAPASRRDMEAAHIDVALISSIMEKRIGEALAKRVKGWRHCIAENCCGGSAEIIENSYYVCVLCGAFNALDSAVISIHCDSSVHRLLTSLYQSAVCNSAHQEHYFPFEGCGHMFVDRFGNPDLIKLRDAASKLPSPFSNARKIGWDLQVFSLLKYILSQPASLRSVKTLPRCVRTVLAKSHELGNLASLNAYELFQIQMDQKSEIAFQMEKRKHGSYYCWHGSNTHNWHNILKTGLEVMSGSKYQANGAAYGDGIYVSPKFGLARGYSVPINYANTNYNNSKPKSNGEMLNSAICLCEIVDRKEIKKNTDIYVVPKKEWCQIRFLFAEFE